MNSQRHDDCNGKGENIFAFNIQFMIFAYSNFKNNNNMQKRTAHNPKYYNRLSIYLINYVNYIHLIRETKA